MMYRLQFQKFTHRTLGECAMVIVRYTNSLGEVRYQMAYMAQDAISLHNPHGYAEILESGSLWELRQWLAADNVKSCGRWSKNI